MKKEELRDKLFEKYFEVDEGILITDLVEKFSYISDVYKNLHILCEKNIEYFDKFSSLKKVMMVEHNQKKYLIIDIRLFKYVIIDVDKMKNITDTQLFTDFDEDFFVDNFNEKKYKNCFPDMYGIEYYNGDLQELCDFYIENKEIFDLSTKIHYKLGIGDAWTYFIIDFVNGTAQMGFQTPDQFLYDQLFLECDLTPSGMQDAIHSIGEEKMTEMFEEIKNMKIPKEIIPSDLLKQFLDKKEKSKVKKSNVGG